MTLAAQERSEIVRRVLVVDDDELSRYVVARRVQRWGLETLVCDDARAALQLLRENPPRAVICDVHMPGLDGMSFARSARQIAPEVPIILLTANPDPTLVASARGEGVQDVLPKHAGGDAGLRQALRRALEGGRPDSQDIQLAHSLRTPLTALKSAIDILCSGDLPDTKRRFAGMAQRNVDRMIFLVERLLEDASVKL